MAAFRGALLSILAALALGPAAAQAQEIKVGGLFDLTGITADVGKPFAMGVRDFVQLTNESGGINGKKIKLVDVDYAYKIPEATSSYKRMVNDEKVLLVNGWGTGDTEALKDTANKDKVPYISASFSAHLTDPAKTPYNFFVAPSYSDQLRAWLTWVKADWKDKSRNPKVAFFYGDNAYGKAPIQAGRLFCKENGIDLVDEEIVPGNFQDATSQLLNMKQKGADYAYINVTITGVSLILRDAKKLGLATKFGTNPYGISETLPLVAKEFAEGVTGVVPHVPYGENVPGMKALLDFHKAKHPADSLGRGAQARRQGRPAQRRGDPQGARDLQGLRHGRPDRERDLHRHRPPPHDQDAHLPDQGRQDGQGRRVRHAPQAGVAGALGRADRRGRARPPPAFLPRPEGRGCSRSTTSRSSTTT
jgi:branched-chain amino acid transport system substrate-binding protein